MEPFQATPLVPNTAICEGERGIQLNVEPAGKLVVWTPGSTLSSTNIYNPVANPVNTTTYRATLTDSAGCFNSAADIQITVNPKPTLDAGPDKILPYNTSYTLTPNFTPNVSSWLWLPNDSLSCASCPNPASIALTTRTYSVIATTANGCEARDVITIFVECKGANIFVPAAFTPNNDYRNDLIRPITRGIQVIKRFAIFNRQGQLMYEVKNREIDKESNSWGWNGKINGRDQEQGAYVYFVEAVCDIGQTIFSKGSFILLR